MRSMLRPSGALCEGFFQSETELLIVLHLPDFVRTFSPNQNRKQNMPSIRLRTRFHVPSNADTRMLTILSTRQRILLSLCEASKQKGNRKLDVYTPFSQCCRGSGFSISIILKNLQPLKTSMMKWGTSKV